MSNGSNASGNNNTSATNNNNNNNNKDQPSTSTIRKIQEWWKKDFDETAFDTMSVDKPDGASYNAFYDPEIGEANHISEMYAPSIHSETSFPDDEVSLNQQQNDDVSTLAPDCGSTMGGESLYTSATKTDNSTVRSGSVYTASEPA